jgi:ferric-dicitrate binding protein FerR (iron transport regulator)
MEKIDYKLLHGFSGGNYSYNDYLKVKDWFTNVKSDAAIEEQLFEEWKELAGSSGTKSLHSIFEKIQYQILLEEKRKEKRRSIWFYYKQIAAVLIPVLVLFSAWYFYTLPEKQVAQTWFEINVPDGARIKFSLPDSTTGWLNSGARLKYPSEFSRHRKVELVGEAFFNVKHLENSDFTVGVKDMNIRVLGTKFNVAAYADESVTDVVLKEGKVEVNGVSTDFRQVIKPGEKVSFNHETSNLNVKKVDADLYAAWTNGCLVIDNEPLEQAAKKLERWYGAEITITDEKLKNFRFKATFNGEPLEEVLKFVAMTTRITYKIEERDKDSNGILKKKQVIISLKQ